MQADETQAPPNHPPNPTAPKTGSLSPTRVFVALVALITLVIGVAAAIATRTSGDSENQLRTASPQLADDFKVTRQFERLNSTELRAYRQEDLSLISTVFTSDSPLVQTVTKEIQGLRRRSVDVRPGFRSLSVSVVSKSENEIILRQTVIENSRFFDSHGRNVTSGPGPQRQVIRWVLRQEAGNWKLFNSTVLKSERYLPL
jgi:hypothetical protein